MSSTTMSDDHIFNFFLDDPFIQDHLETKRVIEELTQKVRKKGKVVHVPPPPPFPTLVTDLNEDVTAKIFEFLDGKALHGASKVSRSFRDALIPRQKAVDFSGFRSFESFQKMGFVGMEYFYGDHCKHATDEVLLTLARDSVSFPSLRGVSLRGCLPWLSYDALDEYDHIRLNTAGRRLEKAVRGPDTW